MTDEKLGALFGGFAHYYWSVPVEYVVNRIIAWHPEVDAKQIGRVQKRINDSIFWHHCYVMTDGVEEPELAVEHLIALGGDDYDQFINARIDAPLCECDEETLLQADKGLPDIPEVRAILDFGKTELGLDDEWAKQLVDECHFAQTNALYEGTSWVKEVLDMERFGKIRFQTIGQIIRYRELGNKLYQVLPNPVLRGWKPTEVENAPVLPDDIPEKDEDIPNMRPEMDEFFAKIGGRENALQLLADQMGAAQPKKRKIGRNEPCPCGSGKKYKKCCGR